MVTSVWHILRCLNEGEKTNSQFDRKQIPNTKLSYTIEYILSNVEGSLRACSVCSIYSRFGSCPWFLMEIVIKVLSSKVIVIIESLMKLIMLSSLIRVKVLVTVLKILKLSNIK